MELYNGENKWSKNIKTQTKRLGGLMNDLLFLARMDENAGKVNAVEFRADSLLEKTLGGFVQPIENKGVALQTEIKPDINLNADPTQIEQLFSILLDNAVKYVDDGGKLRVSLYESERHVKLEFSTPAPSFRTQSRTSFLTDSIEATRHAHRKTAATE